MKTKFDEYLEFPCKFPFKVLAQTDSQIVEKVVAVVQQHAPGDYSPTVKPSGKGNYQSVSIDITATSKEQLETLYKELAEIDTVRMVL
ncbi:DUF493 family protein YbeD [Catenovulum maritimum]|jgi:putative lipoic acid-binding regulatory protein|uniref:UPF0250 protein XM47_05345 n=1 Tax=Catenovulum maritimum TaxID=1513271 RepID=A0A0J8GTX4_9ALTE|nr:DUF493 family protein YbeD [Catenovulum maritimum]KMT66192.1 hypothetical protein XM47_05345 [Catenovulum maritimum]